MRPPRSVTYSEHIRSPSGADSDIPDSGNSLDTLERRGFLSFAYVELGYARTRT